MGGDVALCSPRPSIDRVFQLVGLTRVVMVANSTGEATEHLSSPVVA